MSFLLDIISPSPPSLSARQEQTARRDQVRTELAIHRHGLAAHRLAEEDRLDSQALADAARAALEEELDLLEYGMRRAAGSEAKAVLVARKVELLSTANNRRLQRRFER